MRGAEGERESFFKVYLFIFLRERERERERVCKQGRDRERESENPKQNPTQGFQPMDHEIMT